MLELKLPTIDVLVVCSPPLASSPGGAQSEITRSSDSMSTCVAPLFQVLSPAIRKQFVSFSIQSKSFGDLQKKSGDRRVY